MHGEHPRRRHRVFERTDIAPAVEERRVQDERVLVLYVAEAREPVEDPDHKIRWRVGDHCVPVDRSEWWQRRNERAGLDVMATVTRRRVTDVAPGALVVARRYLAAGGDLETSQVPEAELLRRVGVLRPDGCLTQAGVLVLCPSAKTLIWLTRFDVPGGVILNPPPDLAGLALLEQLALVERDLQAFNVATTAMVGFVEASIRQVPPASLREALLNGIVHRDWMGPDPIDVTWFDEDHVLEVVSPGGFAGGVTEHTVLSKRYARYPALSDLFRALRLVEKQGVGVDRMYREMISLGHRPPRIVERSGPEVLTRLHGGPPALPIMSLTQSLRPSARQRDARIAVILYELLHQPCLSVAAVAAALQTDVVDAAEALEFASTVRADGGVLVRQYKDVWIFSDEVLSRFESDAQAAADMRRRGMLTYRRPSTERARAVVETWLSSHDRITSGDYATLTGLTQTAAKRALDRLVPDVLVRGSATGRNAHYVAA